MERGNMDKHPSYALLSFSRVSGRNQSLFGSSIKHDNTIQMRVRPAKVERNLNTDWYLSDGREYLEIEMSYSQFAESITSMNMGEGIPVTLRYLNGEQIERPNFKNKRLEFENEFQERMNEVESKLNKLTTETEDILTNKKSINKGDREKILNQIKMLQQEVRSNIPFVLSCFNEQMDKTVKEAKGEIEAFTQHKLHSLGMEKLEELKQLK
jgi:ElaB/YqjD/DUF883 family membrane-anchored ribosome-binding protein